jgi:integrase/recombinase XerD
MAYVLSHAKQRRLLIQPNQRYSKDRTLWISESDLEALPNSRERQPKECTTKVELLFITKNGAKLDRVYVRCIVNHYAHKAGIEKHITPHTFRHTFATDLYQDTSKIRLVQKALGHANLATTQIYTHIVDEELEEALKSFRQPAGVMLN